MSVASVAMGFRFPMNLANLMEYLQAKSQPQLEELVIVEISTVTML